MSVITLRPEQSQDVSFLYELYASTRQDELDAWNMPAETRGAFLAMQFNASQASHRVYPNAEFNIILQDGMMAGRLITQRSSEAWRLVDIALLPQYRNAGTGTLLITQMLEQAEVADKTLRLSVLRQNQRAQRLYQRLGFTNTSESDMYLEMICRPYCRAR